MAAAPSPVRLRLFVAIRIPEDVKRRIQDAQRQLQLQIDSPALRWSKPEQFHLTLRFLGGVEDARVPRLCALLAEACLAYPPLSLRASALGCFPRPSVPRVLWVGVSDEGNQLRALHEAVQDATRDFTAEEPETRFAGHITLARIQGGSRLEAEAIAPALGQFAGTIFGEWRATEVELVRSELSPKGARYTTLSAFPLSAGSDKDRP